MPKESYSSFSELLRLSSIIMFSLNTVLSCHFTEGELRLTVINELAPFELGFKSR